MCCDTNKKSFEKTCSCHGGGKPGRFLEPCILLLLQEESTHGYDLIARLERFGFDSQSQDPGAVYRVLRKLETAGMIKSQWETGSAGPAKRQYEVTEAGKEFLSNWSLMIQQNKDRLEKFLTEYKRITE